MCQEVEEMHRINQRMFNISKTLATEIKDQVWERYVAGVVGENILFELLQLQHRMIM